MWTLLLLLLLLALCQNLVVSSLFIGKARKLITLQKLFDNAIELRENPSSTLEEKMSMLIKTSPLTSVQSSVSLVIGALFVSEVLSVIPCEDMKQMRVQCCLAALVSRLISSLQCFNVSEFSIRDQYFARDLMIEAKNEISKLVASPLGMSTAFLAIALLGGSRPGCLLPFLIGEFPNILRYLVVISVVSLPKSVKVNKQWAQWLFPSRNELKDLKVEGPRTVDWEKVCDTTAALVEVVMSASILVGLLKGSNRLAVRGVGDMLLLSAKLLLIQNFLYLRLQSLCDENFQQANISSYLKMLNSYPSMQRLHALVDPTTRGATLRAILQAVARPYFGSRTVPTVPRGVRPAASIKVVDPSSADASTTEEVAEIKAEPHRKKVGKRKSKGKNRDIKSEKK